jgi:hypothetical protein
VTRDGIRPLTACIAALLAATALAACGGSSNSSSSTAATSTAAQASTTASNGGDSGGASEGRSPSNDQSQERGGSQGQAKDGQDGGSGGGVDTPLKVSGGGSGQFRSKGGDNSVQDYGEESGESELQEVAEVVHGFYLARAEEDWRKACSYMAKLNVEQLEQLASQSPQLKGGGCPVILKAFTRPLAAAVERETTSVDAGSFRHEGDQGFLIYYGPGHAIYAMPVHEEDGVWKVAALSATTLS